MMATAALTSTSIPVNRKYNNVSIYFGRISIQYFRKAGGGRYPGNCKILNHALRFSPPFDVGGYPKRRSEGIYYTSRRQRLYLQHCLALSQAGE